MVWLLIVSLVWAFSFGLIKGRLAGVDPALVAWVRVLLAFLVFAPLLRPRLLALRSALVLAGIGGVQFGLMYVCYIAAFGTLAAYEVAALTIFTPVFVALADATVTRRLQTGTLAAATLAVAGAGIIVVDKPLASISWTGVLLVQGSNLCFAAGQIAWRSWRQRHAQGSDHAIFGWLYAGAIAATLPFAWPALPQLFDLSSSHWWTMIYLGVIASGVCFFLWNRGAAQTGAGGLAVANNIKIPLSVACSIALFGEAGDPLRLAVGSAAIVAAGVLAEWTGRRTG